MAVSALVPAVSNRSPKFHLPRDARARICDEVCAGRKDVQLSLVQVPKTIAHEQRLLQIMRDEDGRDGRLPGQALEELLHGLADFRIEIAEWFVEQQQRRFHDDGSSKSHTLAVWPPDNCEGILPLWAVSSRLSIKDSARGRNRDGLCFRSRKPKTMFSNTSRCGKSNGSW